MGRHLTRLLREPRALPPLSERALLAVTAGGGALIVFAALTVSHADGGDEPQREIVVLPSGPTVPPKS